MKMMLRRLRVWAREIMAGAAASAPSVVVSADLRFMAWKTQNSSLMWRTHSCVPCRHSCRHLGRSHALSDKVRRATSWDHVQREKDERRGIAERADKLLVPGSRADAQ